MCIFLLERNCTWKSKAAQTLYYEDGTTLDQPTALAVKSRNTQTAPFPQVSQKAAQKNSQHPPVHGFHPMCWKPALQEIFGNLTQTSINIMRFESLMHPWGTKADSALGYPKLCLCHGATTLAGLSRYYSADNTLPIRVIFSCLNSLLISYQSL